MAPLAHLVRRALAPALLAAAALAAPAHAGILSPPSPHSPNADDMATAYWVMLAIAIILLVAVHAALFAAIGRFRSRRDAAPSRVAAGRGVITRAAVPLAVLAVAVLVFGIVVTTDSRQVDNAPNGANLAAAPERLAQVGITDAPPLPVAPGSPGNSNPLTQGAPDYTGKGPLYIDATAQQWLWRFEYPGNDPQGSPRFSYGELVVPVDTPVILNITSTDVIHTWWVPNLGGQVQAVPGTVSQTWFRADKEGTFRGQSTTFDGTAYPTMRAWVRVVGPDEYQAYIRALQHRLELSQAIVQRQVTLGRGPSAEVAP